MLFLLLFFISFYITISALSSQTCDTKNLSSLTFVLIFSFEIWISDEEVMSFFLDLNLHIHACLSLLLKNASQVPSFFDTSTFHIMSNWPFNHVILWPCYHLRSISFISNISFNWGYNIRNWPTIPFATLVKVPTTSLYRSPPGTCSRVVG